MTANDTVRHSLWQRYYVEFNVHIEFKDKVATDVQQAISHGIKCMYK